MLEINNHEELSSNIENVFGQQGKQWLANLPDVIQDLTNIWQLQNVQPVPNMTWSFVTKADSINYGPVVVKILPDLYSFNNEAKILQYFQGHGVVKLLDYNSQDHAILLPQAIPGISLKDIYAENQDLVMEYYASVANDIFFKPYDNSYNSQHISEWLEAIDRADSSQIPPNILQKAIILKDKLLNSAGENFALHGDLHHDNILQNGNTWIAIDPRGLIGEKEFEVSWFDFIRAAELYDETLDIPTLYSSRVEALAAKLNMSFGRIMKWSFVRLVQIACLMIEGQCDPQEYIDTAIKIDGIITLEL